MKDGVSVRMAVLIAGVVYVALFASHIVAAVNDWNIVFRMIAVAITCMTFFLGWCISVLVPRNDDQAKNTAHTAGVWISAPLAIGLAFAYADQSFSPLLTCGFVATTWITHAITYQRLK
jgi:hypothetical protein